MLIERHLVQTEEAKNRMIAGTGTGRGGFREEAHSSIDDLFGPQGSLKWLV